MSEEKSSSFEGRTGSALAVIVGTRSYRQLPIDLDRTAPTS